MSKVQDVGEVVVAGIAIAVVVALVTGLFYGWILMLLLGLVHHNIAPEVPAAGLFVCFWPAVLIRILFGDTNTRKG